jgi:hypothetical protein
MLNGIASLTLAMTLPVRLKAGLDPPADVHYLFNCFMA